MAGIGLVLNTAKDALLTQQYAMDVVSHNIANVSTEGYSRQTAVIQASTPIPFSGLIFGSGVGLDKIQREIDSFVETRLRDRTSDHAAMTEKETYLNVIEGVFDENSGRSLSSQFDAFWNAWSDLSNNPSGSAERAVLIESGTQICQSFKDIRNDLDQFDQELDLALEAGAQKINQYTSQIATLNEQINHMEVNGNANDLLDQRDMLLRGLSEYIDVNAFTDSEGNLTVTTGRGYTLVSKTDAYDLSFHEDEVKWQSSSGQLVITDTVTGGKMGGWLEVRDEIIPKYKNEFNELARTVVWEVNRIHSQGVGLEGMSGVTGTFAASDPAEELASADSGLDFWDDIATGQPFTVWVYNSAGNAVDTDITITSNIKLNDPADTANSLVHMINSSVANVTAAESDGKLEITAASGYTFAFSNDDSGVLSALGINTFFHGADALEIDVNEALVNDRDLIAAGRIDTTGAFAPGDNTNALDMVALRETEVSLDRYTYGGAATSGTDTLQGYFSYLVGSVGIKSQGIQREQKSSSIS